jgi:hypothetical protein
VLKKRNAANSAWIAVRTLDETFVLSRSSNTILGLSDVGRRSSRRSSFTQTLTAAATLGDGWWVDYQNGGTGVITFDPNAAETINGQTTLAFGPGESGTIYCNGSAFTVVNRSRYAGAIASGRNIAAKNNAATPNTKLDLSADELQLKDANGNVKVVTGVAVTIDFGTTGANGIDTGAQGASTWYYGWVVAKEDGTVAGLGSASSSAPTMPSGYTYKALVSAARSNGSTQFIKYRQFGNRVKYENVQQVVTGGTATTETTVSVTGNIPPIAPAMEVLARAQLGRSAAASANIDLYLRVVTGVSYSFSTVGLTSDGVSSYSASVNTVHSELPNIGNAFIYLFSASTGSPVVDIYITGFTLPLGGQ